MFILVMISAKAVCLVLWKGAILINLTLVYKELDFLFSVFCST